MMSVKSERSLRSYADSTFSFTYEENPSEQLHQFSESEARSWLSSKIHVIENFPESQNSNLTTRKVFMMILLLLSFLRIRPFLPLDCSPDEELWPQLR